MSLIHLLPTEIVCHIISYLDSGSFINLLKTCKYLYYNFKSEGELKLPIILELTKQLDQLSGYKINRLSILDNTKEISEIEYLIFSQKIKTICFLDFLPKDLKMIWFSYPVDNVIVFHVNEDVIRSLSQCNDIKQLTFYPKYISGIPMYMENIKNVRCCIEHEITDDFTDEQLINFSCFPNLRELYYEDNSRISNYIYLPENIEKLSLIVNRNTIIQGIENLTSLRFLSIKMRTRSLYSESIGFEYLKDFKKIRMDNLEVLKVKFIHDDPNTPLDINKVIRSLNKIIEKAKAKKIKLYFLFYSLKEIKEELNLKFNETVEYLSFRFYSLTRKNFQINIACSVRKAEINLFNVRKVNLKSNYLEDLTVRTNMLSCKNLRLKNFEKIFSGFDICKIKRLNIPYISFKKMTIIDRLKNIEELTISVEKQINDDLLFYLRNYIKMRKKINIIFVSSDFEIIERIERIFPESSKIIL